ncbi:MAG TPA: glycine oxidase ThiO [Acidisarcina sp.]|nr:glycine oxidase ThiO [Acidisarcina sp.]
MKRADIVIAGGGIIGLSTALELVAEGLRVVVVERGRPMNEASWAAAGMLASHDPENPPILEALSELSIRLYPAFLERVQALSGQSIPLRTRRALQGTRAGEHFAAGTPCLVDAAQARDTVPGLNSEGRQFLLLDEDSLDPRDLCRALPRAVAAAGAELQEETTVLSVKASGQRVAVETTQGMIDAGHFLNCCGAWSGGLPGATGDFAPDRLGIEPRKGQLVTVQMPDPDSLRNVVRTPETYLVPRGDGRIVIGATLERAGFDKAVDSDVVQTLVDEACALWPPLTAARVVDTWVGLRPGSGDGLPLLGNCGEDRLWMATGHFRNGILLAPATARVMRQLLTGEPPEVPVQSFTPARFAAAKG